MGKQETKAEGIKREKGGPDLWVEIERYAQPGSRKNGGIVYMSLKFKIKDWRFEIDWRGMTAEPIIESRAQSVPAQQGRQVIRRPSAPKANIRKKNEQGVAVVAGD